jgi:hypothetical protein
MFSGNTLYGQITIANPSFEGMASTVDAAAPSWTKCAATPDVQPGIWCVNIAPFAGAHYAGLCSGEYIGQNLPSPILAGVPYSFSMRLAHDLNYYSANVLGVCASARPNPGALEVWAGNSSCTETALLWTSPAISSTTWTLYRANFTAGANYTYIMFECNGTNANILVDSLQIQILPLPVSLLYFKATAEGGAVNLEWATGSELNSQSFTVERSLNAVDFEEVKNLSAAGNSAAYREYTSIDFNPNGGTNYYRLKQTDLDGSSTYSEVIPVKVSAKENRFIPGANPIVSGENIQFKYVLNEGGALDVSVMDRTGRPVYKTLETYPAGENGFSISTAGLNKGIYILRVVSGTQVNTIKLEITN